MKDGLYQCRRGGICAGFEVRDGKVTMVAPILRRRFSWWQQIAQRVGV